MSTPDIADALTWINPDCSREEWVRVLMGIKSATGDDGRDLAEQWSAASDRYQQAAFRDTWRSIHADGGIGAGTVFHLAAAAGWRRGGTTRAPLRPLRKVQATRARDSGTAAYAREIWNRVRCADAFVAAHAYAQAKRITWACGAGRATASGRLIGRDADCIVVPMWSHPGHELVGVECINAVGTKQTFGTKGLLALACVRDATVPALVCEGWACAAGLFLLYQCRAGIFAAFGKGRLKAVADQLHTLQPTREIIVCRECDE